jgi:hypothetical protein
MLVLRLNRLLRFPTQAPGPELLADRLGMLSVQGAKKRLDKIPKGWIMLLRNGLDPQLEDNLV